MHPIIFQIGSFSLRSYGLMAMFGFLTAWLLMRANRRFAGLTDDQASNLLLLAMVTGLVGARIFYVCMFFEHYRDNLWRVFRIDQGGLVFYGGFILAFFSVIAYSKWRKLDIVRVLDVFAPAMAGAHAWGRIGCFLNGCCYGSPTGSSLGVSYPEGSAAALAHPGAKLHPVQLYETAENVIACAVFMYIVRKGRRGAAMSAYLAVYGLCRFVNEFFRGDNPHWWLFTPAQWIGLAMIPSGIVLGIIFGRKSAPNGKAA